MSQSLSFYRRNVGSPRPVLLIFILPSVLFFVVVVVVVVPLLNEANDGTLHSQNFRALRWEQEGTKRA